MGLFERKKLQQYIYPGILVTRVKPKLNCPMDLVATGCFDSLVQVL